MRVLRDFGCGGCCCIKDADALLQGLPVWTAPAHRLCVSLFYVNGMGSTGSRGAPCGFPVCTLGLHSDAGYTVLPLALLGAPVSIGEALG
jgi:hypothetical protein